ncbi:MULTISPECIES: hypothetical protein [Streptomyces]|uniref:Uncharacterized protein n=1 Tax=Streptomyces celluloflavus TaxID=58344 RepID=A0ABW7RJY8_9ACTN|nr:hypothetical protein [Streptomyces sp. SID7805]WSK15939.1 hypothetical protein OG717_31850 [Streptomyces celluloflavus]
MKTKPRFSLRIHFTAPDEDPAANGHEKTKGAHCCCVGHFVVIA